MNKRVIERIIPWCLPALLLVAWQIGAWAGWLSPRFLSSPIAVLQAGLRLAVDGELWRHLRISAVRAGIGLVLGGSLALVLGMWTALSPPIERMLDTSIQMIRTIPHLALIPLVILWFGIEEGAKVFLVALGVFFPIYVNTFHGFRMVDPGLIEMARMYRIPAGRFFTQVLLPGALPAMFVGLRLALGTMWLTLIVAETIAAQAGLGYMAMNAREFMRTDIVLLSIVIYALLGKFADSLVRSAERRMLAWHPSYAIAEAHP